MIREGWISRGPLIRGLDGASDAFGNWVGLFALLDCWDARRASVDRRGMGRWLLRNVWVFNKLSDLLGCSLL